MEQDNLKQGAARQLAGLRAQLAQMTAASQMLERCAVDEDGKQYLAMLNQGICRTLRLVSRMELCGRLAGETPDVTPAPADLGELTTGLGRRMEGLLERAGVELTVAAPEYLLARVDAPLLRQLLLELVANGARAGKRVWLTLKRDGENAVFTVADDGPGVAPEKLPFLFDSQAEQQPDWRRGGLRHRHRPADCRPPRGTTDSRVQRGPGAGGGGVHPPEPGRGRGPAHPDGGMGQGRL